MQALLDEHFVQRQVLYPLEPAGRQTYTTQGALGLLLSGAAGPVPEPQQELLTIAQNNVGRLIRLVNDILDIARIEADPDRIGQC